MLSQGGNSMEKSYKEKNEELRKFWKNHINQWSQADLSQIKYCRQNDLIPHRFTYWKRKFEQQHLPVEFVQIPDPLPVNSPGLKLNIGPGLQIEIPDGFSSNTLGQVLKTLNIL